MPGLFSCHTFLHFITVLSRSGKIRDLVIPDFNDLILGHDLPFARIPS